MVYSKLESPKVRLSSIYNALETTWKDWRFSYTNHKLEASFIYLKFGKNFNFKLSDIDQNLLKKKLLVF